MYKILVADDETKIRETIKDYFSAKNFTVYLAANGSEAVKSAKKHQFDLIILDVMMPVTDGLTACKKIRKISSVPILFLSALGEEHDFLNGYICFTSFTVLIILYTYVIRVSFEIFAKK